MKKILDLNMDPAFLEDSAYNCDGGGGGGGDDSGSGASNVSSVVISAICDPTVFKFSILNKAKNDGYIMEIKDDFNENGSIGQQPGLQTRQLFPVTGEEEEDEELLILNRPRQWLNLAVPEVVDVAGKHITPIPSHCPQPAKKSRRGPRSRSSQFRGVTFYRRTGRWESHIWDCRKQVYLGGFDTAHAAARAYDRAAIKFRGVEADINFHISDYEEDIKQMKNLSKEEFVQVLRPRQNAGLSRSNSKYRNTLDRCGQWSEAQMNHFLGKKAFETSALECNERNAVVNFELSSSCKWDSSRSLTDVGRGRSLDLNLWISPSSESQMKIEDSKTFHAHCLASEPLDGKRIMIMDTEDNSARQQNSVIWSSKYSCCAPKDEEKARNLRLQAMALPGYSNRPWKLHHGVVPSVAFSSLAASSGFSSTNNTFSPVLVPMNAQNMSTALSSKARYPPMPLNYN